MGAQMSCLVVPLEGWRQNGCGLTLQNHNRFEFQSAHLGAGAAPGVHGIGPTHDRRAKNLVFPRAGDAGHGHVLAFGTGKVFFDNMSKIGVVHSQVGRRVMKPGPFGGQLQKGPRGGLAVKHQVIISLHFKKGRKGITAVAVQDAVVVRRHAGDVAASSGGSRFCENSAAKDQGYLGVQGFPAFQQEIVKEVHIPSPIGEKGPEHLAWKELGKGLPALQIHKQHRALGWVLESVKHPSRQAFNPGPDIYSHLFQTIPFPLRLQRFDESPDHGVVGSGNLGLRAILRDLAIDEVHFGAPAGFDVLEHRRLVMAGAFDVVDAIRIEARTQGIFIGPGDSHSFLDEGAHQVEEDGILDELGHGLSRHSADWIHAAVEDGLAPHQIADLIGM